jgi:hypothetical protein
MARFFIFMVRLYIPLTLYPRRGSRSITDITLRHLRFNKITQLCNFSLCVIHKEGLCSSSGEINRLMMTQLWGILQTWQVVIPSLFKRSPSQVWVIHGRRQVIFFYLVRRHTRLSYLVKLRVKNFCNNRTLCIDLFIYVRTFKRNLSCGLEQNKIIAPLSFFHGCHKRRLND